jgi:phosphatidylglycerophosphatase C
MPQVHSGEPVVAAFDFDGTLTRGDTLLPFLRLVLGWPRLLWALILSVPWLLAYALRLIGNERAKARLLRVCLRGRAVDDMQGLARRFTTQVLPSLWNPNGLQQLRRHMSDGHHCLIVSASPDIYLGAVATQLGMAGLICTELEAKHGRLTGAMGTRNCHGEEKARRLQAWMAERFPHVPHVTLHAYGDSRGDLAMLRLANYAVYRGKPFTGPHQSGHRPP